MLVLLMYSGPSIYDLALCVKMTVPDRVTSSLDIFQKYIHYKCTHWNET